MVSKTRPPSKPDARKSLQQTHMQDKTGNIKYDRQDIADVFAEFYEELYTSTTKRHEHEHEDTYEQHHHTVKPFTMQELNDAIHLKRGRAADTRGVNAEMIKYSTRRLEKTPSTTVQQGHQTVGTRRSQLCRLAGTQQHHRTTDPFFRCPSCTNSSVISSASDDNPR